MSGYLARAIQHEADHVDGVLFTDRLSIVTRQLLRKKLDELIRGEVPQGYHPVEGREGFARPEGRGGVFLKPRAVFMGTPEFSVPALHAVADRCDVTLVVTQPDRPAGRGRHMAESAVASAASALGLPVLKPADMKAPEVRERLAAELESSPPPPAGRTNTFHPGA